MLTYYCPETLSNTNNSRPSFNRQSLQQKYAERSRQVCPSGAQGFSRHKVKANRKFFLKEIFSHFVSEKYFNFFVSGFSACFYLFQFLLVASWAFSFFSFRLCKGLPVIPLLFSSGQNLKNIFLSIFPLTNFFNLLPWYTVSS